MLNSVQKSNRFQFHPLPSVIFLISCLLVSGSPGFASSHHFLENGNPTLLGADAGFMADTPTRIKIDLSGQWDYELEGGEKGSVRIPAAFEGKEKVTYSRTFEVTAEQLDRSQFQLVMFGANYAVEISINGEFVGNHVGGYTSFVQPIPKELLQVGKENRIQVAVSSLLDSRRTIPPRGKVWEQRNYGGILRDIFILVTPSLRVRDAVVSTALSKNGASAIVTVKAGVEGQVPVMTDTAVVPKGSRPKPAPVPAMVAEVFDRMSGTLVARSGLVTLVQKGSEWDEASLTAEIPDPKLWSPDTPDLYVVKCSVVMAAGKDITPVDEFDQTFGIRHLEMEDGNFVLNGRRLILHGVVWNEHHPTWGSALPYEQMEKDVVMIKSLGANAIRFAGHPPHPYMLNLCDRYGLFALEELPVTGVPSSLLRPESYGELAAGMLREMVGRDRNHPSVLAWGLGDDYEPSSPDTRQFLASLVSSARSLDARPLYYGAPMRLRDTCSDLVSFVAIDARAGDLKSFKSQMEAWRDAHAETPVVVGQLGVEVQHDNRNGYSDPFSQEAQARFFIQRLDALKVLEFDGAFVWSFNDYRGARPALTVHSGDPMVCSTGLVSLYREKRLAYEAVQAVFRGEKFKSLPAGSYSTNAPMIYVLMGFVVLVGVAYLYNANRRFRESINRSFFNTYNFFADVRDQRIVSLVQTSVLALVIAIAAAIVGSSILYHFRDNLFLDNILSILLVSDALKAFVVRLVWHPVQFIAVATIVIFVKLFLVSVALMLLKVFFRARIYMFHAYAVSVWSTTPMLLFIPAGMILFRVMESSLYVIPSLAFVGVLIVWVVLRFLKGVSIIFDVPVIRMYLLGLALVVVVAGSLYVAYDSTRALPDYVTYLFHLTAGS